MDAEGQEFLRCGRPTVRDGKVPGTDGGRSLHSYADIGSSTLSRGFFMPTAKDVIRNTSEMANFIMGAYLEDLPEEAFFESPGAGLNPIAWQVGHLISAENGWLEKIKPGSCPKLPEGFEAAHTKETAVPNTFKKVATKDEYLAAWKAQRDATLAVLDGLPDSALDGSSGVEFAPTVATLLNMAGVHPLMHVGQFVALRRKHGLGVKI